MQARRTRSSGGGGLSGGDLNHHIQGLIRGYLDNGHQRVVGTGGNGELPTWFIPGRARHGERRSYPRNNQRTKRDRPGRHGESGTRARRFVVYYLLPSAHDDVFWRPSVRATLSRSHPFDLDVKHPGFGPDQHCLVVIRAECGRLNRCRRSGSRCGHRTAEP